MAISRITNSSASNSPTTSATDIYLNIASASLQVGDWLIVAVTKYIGSTGTPTAPDTGAISLNSGNITIGTVVRDVLATTSYGNDPTTYLWAAIFHIPVTGAGTGTEIRVVGHGAHWMWASVVGIRGASALTVEDSDQGTGASGGAVTGTVSCAGAGYFAGTAAWDSATDITITQVSPWTQIFSDGNADTEMSGALLEQIPAGATTDAAEWSSPTTVPWSAAVVAYTDGTGGVAPLGISVGTVLIETPF